MARLQLPRATSTVISTYAPNEGEIFYDITNDEVKADAAGVVAGKALAWKDGSNLTASSSLVTATGGATARTLADRFAERYSVTDFGVVMDSSSDQSSLMQAALTAATGGVLFVPEGTIYCKALTIPFDTSIVGVEQDKSILKLPAAANTYILAATTYVNNNTYSDLAGVISDLTLDGNKANQTVAAALLIDRGFDGTRERVYFKDSKGRGVLLTALSANATATTNGIANNRYVNCFFNGNVQEHWYGEDGAATQLADFDIVDCAFGAGNDGGGTPVYAIHSERSAGAKVCRNQIYGGGAGQVKLLKSGRSVFAENHIDMDAQVNSSAGAAYGVYVELGGHAHASVASNVFHMSKASAGSPTWQHLLVTSVEADAICALAGNTFFSNAFTMLAWTHGGGSGYTLDAGNAYYQSTQPTLSANARRALTSSATGTWAVDANLTPTTNDGAALGTTALMFSDIFLASGAVTNWNNGDVTETHSADALTWAGATTYAFSQSGAAATASISRTDTHGSSQYVGHFAFNGRDSAANAITYGRVSGYATDATDASEDGQLEFAVMTAGTLTAELGLLGSALFPATNDGLALGFGTLAFSDLFLASGGALNWNNGDVTVTHSSNLLAFAGASSGYTFDALVSSTASLAAHSGTGIPAGGTAGAGLLVSSTSNFGVFFGSGAPSLTAAKGSLYLRSDGSSTSTRMYVATDSAGAWTAVTTAT